MKSLALFSALTLSLCANAPAQLDKVLAPVSFAAALPPAPGDVLAPAKPTLHLLKPEEAVPLLEKQLREHFSLEGELKLETSSSWGRILVPTNYDLTIIDYPGGGVTNSFVVRCKLTGEGQSLGEFQVPLKAQLWREVWVAEGRLDRGQTLDRSLVNARTIDVLREHDALLFSDMDPTIYDLAQSVAPGRPLTRRDVSERPVIHKGEVVDVVAHQGTFAIRMKALALENGVAKELIKMRNIESRRDFTAEVINESQVQVHF
jgi:flagella basal body P-ring formation protein FlgA